MISLVFRVLTFAGSAAIFGFLTREYLRRKAEQEQERGKQLPSAPVAREANDTVDVEIISGEDD